MPLRITEKEQLSGSTVLIFGQGPVVTEPKEKANYWSEDLAQAAAILKKHDPNIQRFVIMGGKTGGSGYSSEASLIAQEMQRLGVDREAIQTEEMSNDTIENVVNFLNLFSNEGNIDEQKFSILCAPYHSPRVQVLMQLFKIPVANSFQSTEVMRYAARTAEDESRPTHDSTKWNSELLQTIEDKININDPTKYSAKQSGSEKRDVSDRYIKDDLWTRELLEYPEKWLSYVGKLNNGERVRAILAQVENLYPNMLKEKYGIIIPESLDEESLSQLKTKLVAIPKSALTGDTIEQWVEDNKSRGWSKDTEAMLEKLINIRYATKDKSHLTE